MAKYEFTPKMGEISGKGKGSEFEDKCRDMLLAGLRVNDRRPGTIQKIDDYNNLKQFYESTDSDVVELREALIDASGDGTTPEMMIAVFDHLKWVDNYGWDAYVDMMENK